MSTSRRFQWPTWAILCLCYVLFAVASTWLANISIFLAIGVVGLSAALHSSLSHEMMHGHPFKNKHLNAALVFPAISLAVPYMRFRDTHLAHHVDERLTDPYDDPESCYMDPKVWNTLSDRMKTILKANNTLAGRMLIGPVLGQFAFMATDWALIRKGDRRVLLGWLWHIPAAILPLWWLAILKIRTFLEHQAHEDDQGRTVIIEDRGLFSLLFLNNNFHSVHHQHPGIVWYDLPKLYDSKRNQFLQHNGGYHFSSYAQVFRSYFFKTKEPVSHPLWPKSE